jgi:hypothetical protein
VVNSGGVLCRNKQGNKDEIAASLQRLKKRGTREFALYAEGCPLLSHGGRMESLSGATGAGHMHVLVDARC